MIDIVELCWMPDTYREHSASSLIYNSDNRIDCRKGSYKAPRQKNPPVLQVSLRVNSTTRSSESRLAQGKNISKKAENSFNHC